MDTNQDAKAQVALAWKVLYDQPYEDLLDPNKPENSARMNIIQQQKQEALTAFLDGPGKPLLDDWKRTIQGTNLSLLFMEHDCTCQACMMIRDIKNLLRIMQMMQQTMEGKEKD